MDVTLRRLIRALAGVLAIALSALAVTLVIYVSGEDDYVGGASRWAARAGDTDARTLFWLSIGLAVTAVAALGAGAVRNRVRSSVAGTALGLLAAATIAVAFIAFTAN